MRTTAADYRDYSRVPAHAQSRAEFERGFPLLLVANLLLRRTWQQDFALRHGNECVAQPVEPNLRSIRLADTTVKMINAREFATHVQEAIHLDPGVGFGFADGSRRSRPIATFRGNVGDFFLPNVRSVGSEIRCYARNRATRTDISVEAAPLTTRLSTGASGLNWDRFRFAYRWIHSRTAPSPSETP